ncbi:DUF599 domain-containing protein [Paracoccus sediminis]|uniref:DUF599 domain-containing protein n=1 Tax=Paracoccus sediminis TaxID=1214787 RepID=A0A238XKQ2_9RHOB|nr:DUF599 domain-containing protein [Paracoccus sediminis]TBN48561.1 DUF599 domain-containing protein [Paracoccus sediminis]SNR59053.1 Uncharacterized membrane protein [Paracoccus sediminis]
MDVFLPLSVAWSIPDLSAIALLFVTWFAIGWLTERPPAGKPSVSVLMKRFRREWMVHFLTRDPRIFDGNILTSLREGTAFFASACMIATGGILALIGNTDQLRGLASELALERPGDILWELKLLVTMFFVVNAFLKFVWAHRLFGYCAIMMAAVPNDPDDPMARDRAMQAADLNITAARSFNAGLRSVYFALGSLGWLAGPWALMLGTAVVLFVTWRREFASTSRQVIMRSLPPPRLPDHARLPASGQTPPQP